MARVAAQTAQQQEQLTAALQKVNERPQAAEGPQRPPPQGNGVPFDTGSKILKPPEAFSPATIEEEVSQRSDWSFAFKIFLVFMD